MLPFHGAVYQTVDLIKTANVILGRVLTEHGITERRNNTAWDNSTRVVTPLSRNNHAIHVAVTHGMIFYSTTNASNTLTLL